MFENSNFDFLKDKADKTEVKIKFILGTSGTLALALSNSLLGNLMVILQTDNTCFK